MKIKIVTAVNLPQIVIDEVKDNIDCEVLPITSSTIKPVPEWNDFKKRIQISWNWHKTLFIGSKADVFCYIPSRESIEALGIPGDLYGLHRGDKDSVIDIWASGPSRLRPIAKKNGFKTNLGYTICHEISHGREANRGEEDRTHAMCDQGRLKELLALQEERVVGLLEKKLSLLEMLKEATLAKIRPQFARPLPNHWSKVTQKFLNPNKTLYPATGVHVGTDFAAPKNTPVLAPCDGQITRSSYSPVLGNWVEFKMGGLYLVALHLVSRQQPRRVRRGEPIGFVGDTGMIKGIHAHLEGWYIAMDRDRLTSKEAVENLLFDITDLIR